MDRHSFLSVQISWVLPGWRRHKRSSSSTTPLSWGTSSLPSPSSDSSHLGKAQGGSSSSTPLLTGKSHVVGRCFLTFPRLESPPQISRLCELSRSLQVFILAWDTFLAGELFQVPKWKLFLVDGMFLWKKLCKCLHAEGAAFFWKCNTCPIPEWMPSEFTTAWSKTPDCFCRELIPDLNKNT